MKIDKQFLTISNYNRPGSIRKKTSAIACHYIGNPDTLKHRQIAITLRT